MQHICYRLALAIGLLFVLQSCGSAPKAEPSLVTEEDRLTAMTVLNQTIKPATNSTTTTSTDIDWVAGILPWDRFTLPVISPNGLHAAVQLGTPPSMSSLSGSDHSEIDSTTIELHILDPIQGRRIAPFPLGKEGLILCPSADDHCVLVESPNGEQGRAIGKIDWATGNLSWL
ncbi:MAG: hypothetical protein QGF07_01510, partial [Phycisphaerales bacterium]|nr:hypothetical protein [Phycisphaerales bacterium]